jgi:hypothetical protein
MDADTGSAGAFRDVLWAELTVQLCLESGDFLGTCSRERVECWCVWIGLIGAVIMREMLVARIHLGCKDLHSVLLLFNVVPCPLSLPLLLNVESRSSALVYLLVRSQLP